MGKPKIIIDCDPGCDDLCAIAFAAEFADVVGIVSVSGNVPLEYTTRNALFAAELTNLDVPVIEGAEKPLACEAKYAPEVHGETGLGVIKIPSISREVSGTDANEYLLQASRDYDDLWIVAIGPLTNIAWAMLADHDFARRIAGISIMGGSTSFGNCNAVAEFNFWADPEAADIVLRSEANMKMCGLNLTHQVQIDDKFAGRLAKMKSKGAKPFQEMVPFMLETADFRAGERRSPLHDPCAVAAITHPELFRFESRNVNMELHGHHTRGMSVVEERMSERGVDTNIEVAYEIDAPKMFDLMLESIAAIK